jgi:glycosyltransferase involved in cell wall biosynthesis
MAAANKHLAMIGYTFYAGDQRLRRTVRTLRKDGWTVDVITLRNPRTEAEHDQDGVKFFLPRTRDYGHQGKVRQIYEYVAFTIAAGWIMLRNHLFRQRYAIVHVNNMPNFLIFGALPLRLLGVPVLLDIHDTMPEIYQDKFKVGPEHWIIRILQFEEWLCIKLSDFVLTTEHTKWERLQKNGLSTKKSAVTLNLADPATFPLQPIADIRPAHNPFRLVYHGTLARRLGMDVALRAVALLRGRIPGLRLEITGDGEQRLELLALANELQINDLVHFSDGFVAGEELLGRLAGADLAVVPSRNNIATGLMLPVKLLEYVTLGIPAVTVATPTITRYFDHSQVRFVPEENPQALADAIEYLYHHPEERRQLAVNAREFFKQHDFAAYQQIYMDVVHNLTGTAQPQPV